MQEPQVSTVYRALGLFRSGFRTSATPMVLLSTRGRVFAANAAFCDLVGRSEAELRRLRIDQITVADSPAPAPARTAPGEKDPFRVEVARHYLRPDGVVVPVSVDAVTMEDEHGHAAYSLEMAKDLTPRIKLEQAAVRRAAHLDLVRTVALAANASDECEAPQQVALDQICALTGWESGRVLLPKGSRWVVGSPEVGSGPRVQRLRVDAKTRAGADGTPQAVLLAAGGSALAWTSPARVGSNRAAPFSVVVGVPVLVGDEIVAVLEFLGQGTVQEPDAALLAALDDVGVQLGRVTERERGRSALAAEQARQLAILEYAADAFVESDSRGRITAWNPEAERVFGWRALEVLGRPVSEVLIPPRLRAAHEEGLARILATGTSRLHGQRVQLPALHRDGHEFPVQLSLSVRPDGPAWVVQAFLRDVSEQERVLRELHAQNDLLDTVLDGLADGVVACGPDGRLTLVNRSHLDLWRLPDEPRPPEQWLDDLLMFEADGITPLPIERAPLYRALQDEEVAGQVVVVGRPGNYRTFRCKAAPLVADDGRRLGAVCTLHDVTERVAAERSVVRLLRTDATSGLPNRTALLDRLQTLPERRSHTLVQLHAEDLSPTLAVEGPSAGEELVGEIAERLAGVVRAGDLVVHMGGERFAVLVSHDARTDGRGLVERMLRAFDAPWTRGGRSQRLSVTAGLACVDPADVVRALSESELALQTARAAGPGRLEVFDSWMSEQLQQRRALVADLEQALVQGEFLLRYQPLVHVRTGRIHGVEALVRWQHPTRGLVPPDEFVPLAEDTGLIVPLGRWVLTEACEQAARWRDRGLPGVRMSVNVSGRQLDERFVQDVAAVLEGTGMQPELLDLEITETVAIGEEHATFELLEKLRQLGVTLSVDDFGTGYSVLGRLRTLPFSHLKIDRSFISEITGSDQAPLITAMLEMAHGLGLHVVAEGVETVQQLEYLRAGGCDLAQGYLFARPVDADTVAGLLLDPAPLPGYSGSPEPARPSLTLLQAPADLTPLLAEVERLTGMESVYFTRVQDGMQQVLAARNTGDLDVAEGLQTPWESSLCAQALADGPTSLVDVNLRYGDNVHVAALGLVSYVGVPVTAPDGTVLGTLCGASRSQRPVPVDTLDVVGVYAKLAAERLLRSDLVRTDEVRLAALRRELAERGAFLAEAEVSVRQPLTVLMGWLQLLDLRREDLTAGERASLLASCISSVHSLTRHLDRLLDDARTAVLRQDLRGCPLSLRTHLGDLVASRSASRRHEVVLGDDADVDVHADPLALSKTVSDLLDNAADYSGAGSLTRLRWRVVHGGVEISVVDQGIGLEPGLDVFAPYTRGVHPAVRAVPGAGLSLHVSRALAEAMGGTLLGRRNRGAGSTFVLWLPVAYADRLPDLPDLPS